MGAQKCHTLLAQRNLRLRKPVWHVVTERHILCFLVVIVCYARNALMNVYADQIERALYVGSNRVGAGVDSWS
jgi:hypothetical protein